MRLLALLYLLALLLPLGLARAAADPLPVGLDNTYDYAARQRLALDASKRGDTRTALYHGAWLMYLGPKRYSEAAEVVLQGRNLRDRSHHLVLSGVYPIIVAAQDARRALLDTCGNGTVPSQGARLQDTVLDLLQQAEQAQDELPQSDPVARACVADLYLTLDDAMRLAGQPARDRRQILRRAATAAEAAAQALPDAPGGHRLSAIAWARQSELGSDPGELDLAITACSHAFSPDPDDPMLWELMWSLHLRAGHWEEAQRWQQRCEQGPNKRGAQAPASPTKPGQQ